MSLLRALLAAAILTLIVLHMARPRFRRHLLSAARFFYDLPPAEDTRRRFQLGNPLRSRPLYPQLLILGLLAGALLSVAGCESDAPEERLGVWVLVDTSLSMTTVQGGETRLDVARREIRRFLDEAEDAGERPPCFRWSAFDMELYPLAAEPLDRAALESSLRGLEARPLGTDLGPLRALSPAEERQEVRAGSAEDACPTQVRLAVSDLPAPDWAGADSGWIWRDVAQPVENVGLVAIEAVRDPFGGRVDSVAVEVASYGAAPSGLVLEVTDALGSEVAVYDVETAALDTETWRQDLLLAEPGLYRLRLRPGGAYRGDDEAVIEVPEGGQLRVDWRLGARPAGGRAGEDWIDLLGWRRAAEDADLVVIPPGQAAPGRPTLIVGDQYGRGPASEIGFFEADSPLLDSLSFDVAEASRILGVDLPAGLDPVLAGPRLDRDVWVARRDRPRAVYVPGLPTSGGDSLGSFSATLFVQSLRWLLAGTPPPALYTLTSPARPEVEGTRIALHEGEGKTDHQPLSRGDVTGLRPAVRKPVTSPAWPWWLVWAAGVFLIEQVLLAFGGESWR